MFDEINTPVDQDGYQHRWIDGSPIDIPVGKAVCVGRNYADHARELGNAVPDARASWSCPRRAPQK